MTLASVGILVLFAADQAVASRIAPGSSPRALGGAA